MSGTDGYINGDRDCEEKVFIMSVSADSSDEDLEVLGLRGRIPQPRQSCMPANMDMGSVGASSDVSTADMPVKY